MTAVRLVMAVTTLLLLAGSSGWPVLSQLAYGLIGLALAALALTWAGRGGLRLATRLSAARGQVGGTLERTVVVDNRAWWPRPNLELDDRSTLPALRGLRTVDLPARQTATYTQVVSLVRRGRYRLGPVGLRLGDPFGLFKLGLPLGEATDYIVYPAVEPVRPLPATGTWEATDGSLRVRTDSISPGVAGVREYQWGDAFNRIAWAPSARMGRLVVKEFEDDPSLEQWVVLDLDRRVYALTPRRRHDLAETPHWRTTTEEFAVVVAASLADDALAAGRSVGLMALARHVVVLAPDRGVRQRERLLETLAVVRADGSTELGAALLSEAAHFARRCGVTVITPAGDDRWCNAVAQLRRLGARPDVALVDAASFGAGAGPARAQAALVRVGIGVRVVGATDDLATALGASSGSLLARAAGGGRPW